MKRILSFALCLMLAVSMSVTAFAAAATSGTCGANVSWRIDKGVLSITGSGDMMNYGKVNNAPWYTLRSSVSEIVIADGITNIGDYAFYNTGSSLRAVTIPASVKSIGNFAFADCQSIEEIIIPIGVTSIGNSAFKGCKALKSTVIPTGVTTMGTDVFGGCEDIESAVISRSLKSVAPRTFSGCSMLASVIVPDGVEVIDEEAFAGCSYLKTVSIGKDVKTIKKGAFSNCAYLEAVNYAGDEAGWKAVVTEENNDALTKASVTYGSKDSADDETIMVLLNGKKLTFDQPPVISEGRTLVPLRAIFEALGATVEWDDASKTVTAKKGYTVISLQIGSKEITIDTTTKALDVPAQIINSRTLVPVRAVSEAFGCSVIWDGITQTVIING